MTFNEIPLELFPLVVLAATGGGAQLIGAGLGARAVRGPEPGSL